MVNKKWVIIVLILWGLGLIGFIGYKQYTLSSGVEIILKTVPVDPRDFFRGDYVVLRYNLNSMDSTYLEQPNDTIVKGDIIYVLLNSSSKYPEPVSISKTKFESGVFLKGTVESTYYGTINIRYGIESYFVQEGKGKEIERMIGKLDVKIAVDKQGNALIKSLIYEQGSK